MPIAFRSYSDLGIVVQRIPNTTRCWASINTPSEEARIRVAKGLYIHQVYLEYLHGDISFYPTCGNSSCISTLCIDYIPLNIPEPEPPEEMSELKDIKKSVSEMSDEELMEMISGTRARRRAVPEKKKKEARAKTKEKVAKKSANDISALLGALTDEEKQKLLKELG